MTSPTLTTHGGRRFGAGRRKRKDRCPCGAMTRARARRRGHLCPSIGPAAGANGILETFVVELDRDRRLVLRDPEGNVSRFRSKGGLLRSIQARRRRVTQEQPGAAYTASIEWRTEPPD